MAAFGDVTSADGIKALDDHLAHHSYVSGHQLSSDDITVAQQLSYSQVGSNPHLKRWYTHIHRLDPHVTQQLQAEAQSTATAGAGESTFHLDVSDSDEDFNLSDDDDDGGAAALIKKRNEEALAKVKEKEKLKPKARSSIIWDVKPEDDTTDMDQLEKSVRAIQLPSLEWQGSDRVPVAYGIMKLRIISQIVDDDIATDDIQEAIESIEGVQSSDIFAFNKV